MQTHASGVFKAVVRSPRAVELVAPPLMIATLHRTVVIVVCKAVARLPQNVVLVVPVTWIAPLQQGVITV